MHIHERPRHRGVVTRAFAVGSRASSGPSISGPQPRSGGCSEANWIGPAVAWSERYGAAGTSAHPATAQRFRRVPAVVLLDGAARFLRPGFGFTVTTSAFFGLSSLGVTSTRRSGRP